MTVQELINQLQGLPQDAQVCVCVLNDNSSTYWAVEAKTEIPVWVGTLTEGHIEQHSADGTIFITCDI
jgi:hypothetical protein